MIHGDLPLVGSLYIIPLRSIDKLFPGALRMAVSLHSTAPRLSYPMAHITVRCHAINASLSPTPPPLGAKLMAHCRSRRGGRAGGRLRALSGSCVAGHEALGSHCYYTNISRAVPYAVAQCSCVAYGYSMGHGRPPDDCSVAMTLRVRAVSIDSPKPLTHWHGLTASAPRTITITPSHLPPKGREVCQA